MRPWMKKSLIVLAFLVVACCMSLGGVLYYYDFDPSQDSAGTFHPLVYYKINSASILTDIDKGNVENAFRLLDVELTVFPDIYPSGSFLWTQEDYMKIANAHLFYQTGETMEDGWRVYGKGEFRITDCSDGMRGFDWAEMRLFKQALGGEYDVLATDIRPLEEVLMSGERRFKAIPFDDRYVPAKVIESNLTAEDALQIAEQVIGMEMRRKLSNDGCDVSVSYSRDEYWNVSYWWSTENLHFNLDIDVDVNDKQYKIRSHVYKCERTICP